MDELVGVGFEFLAAFVVGFVRPAEGAAAVLPGMFDALEADVAFGGVKGLADGILAVGGLGAIDRAARKQAGQLGDGDTEELVFHDVVDTLLAVGDFGLQPLVEPAGNLTQKHARLAGRVEKSGLFVAPELFRQQIKHPVHQLQRREHLVAAQVRNA